MSDEMIRLGSYECFDCDIEFKVTRLYDSTSPLVTPVCPHCMKRESVLTTDSHNLVLSTVIDAMIRRNISLLDVLKHDYQSHGLVNNFMKDNLNLLENVKGRFEC